LKKGEQGLQKLLLLKAKQLTS